MALPAGFAAREARNHAHSRRVAPARAGARTERTTVKLLWKEPKIRAVSTVDAPAPDVRPEPRSRPRAHAAPAPLPISPFDLATGTLLVPPDDDERARFRAHLQKHPAIDDFWEHAPVADWMLDVLRNFWHWIPVAPERQLRRFALECASGLTSAGAPALADVGAMVRRRIAGEATLHDLEAVRMKTRDHVMAGGIQGLPRCIPYAAGALAVWHAADPQPFDAAFRAGEFAALHHAFVALESAAAGWRPSPPIAASWHAARFAESNPQIRARALRNARERQAVRLRELLPQPFYALQRVRVA